MPYFFEGRVCTKIYGIFSEQTMYSFPPYTYLLNDLFISIWSHGLGTF